MYIYKVVNNINKRWYIGKHCKPINGNRYKKYYGSGKLIKLALSKYGVDNFTKIVLESCSTKTKLAERELYWINKYLKNDKDNLSYNLQSKYYIGREKGHKQSSEHIRKRVEARLKKDNFKWSDKSKKRMSDSTKGKPPNNKGMKCPNIAKAKIGKKNPMARKVILIKTGDVFDTIKEASNATGVLYATTASRLSRGSKKSLIKYA